MPHPDRTLRRLVAGLANADPADIRAVLAGLEPGRRETVRLLLGEYAGDQTSKQFANSDGEAPSGLTLPGLSPWLQLRAGADLGVAEGEGLRLTHTAHAALAAAVALVATENNSAAAGRGWFGERRWGEFWRRGQA